MNRIAILLSLLFISVAVSSCGVKRYIPIENSQKDSVIIHVKDSVIYRDSIIFVQVPKESTSAILASSDSSHLETGIAESDAWVEDGQLHHTLRNKHEQLQPISVNIPYKVHSTEEKRLKLATKTIIQEVEKELSWWQVLWIRTGQLAWCVVLGYLILTIIRKSLKIP